MKSVERDWKVRRLTTHTPEFLGLPTEVWPTGGGFDKAGEDIVIGFVDSGIYPLHPSFAAHEAERYGPVSKFRGKCEVDPDTKRSFCNGKIVGAQHFAKAAIAAGAFNPAVDYASPLDGDGHGRLELFNLMGIFTACIIGIIRKEKRKGSCYFETGLVLNMDIFQVLDLGIL